MKCSVVTGRGVTRHGAWHACLLPAGQSHLLPLSAPPPPPCSLKAEGLQFFRRDWRYRWFISCGEPDGLQALLGTARRQLAARLSEGERYRELAER